MLRGGGFFFLLELDGMVFFSFCFRTRVFLHFGRYTVCWDVVVVVNV